MSESLPTGAPTARSKFFYGWIIAAACMVLIAVTYGLTNSYSVFFKPLIDFFHWDRATVSLIFSVSLFIRGIGSIATGYFTDKYGARKLALFCGFMVGLGLILSSQIQELWQLFVTYALLVGIGLSGFFGIATTCTSRWFTKNRGLALGIVSSGSGLGTLLLVPVTERLIDSFNWSTAFIISGIVGGGVFIVAALLLKTAPVDKTSEKETASGKNNSAAETEVSLGKALHDPRLLLLMGAFPLFFFGLQIIMVHLVAYATDMGITPLVAATFIGLIGVASIVGRLATGLGTDKIGIHNTLIITNALLVVSFIWLIFCNSLWSFYLFAAIFGFTYGGEVPLIPLFVGKYFGTRSMATLVGATLFMTSLGGALGPWLGGRIFDVTQSYQGAFIAGAVGGLIAIILALILKRLNPGAR